MLTRQEMGTYITMVFAGVVMSEYVPVTLSNVAYVILAVCIAYTIYKSRRTTESTDTLDVENKKNVLSKIAGLELTYFTDNYTLLFYRVRHFEHYSKGYALTLRHTNNFLRLLSDFHTGRLAECQNTVNIATGVYRNAMNSFHSILFGVPSVKGDLLGESHTKVMGELQELLLQDLADMKKVCPGTTDLVGPKEGYSPTELALETNYDIFI